MLCEGRVVRIGIDWNYRQNRIRMSSLGHGGVDHHRAEVCGIRGGFGGRDGWGVVVLQEE